MTAGRSLPRRRRGRWLLGGLVAAGLVAGVVVLASRDVRPEQPIRFSHALHVTQVDCATCHEGASTRTWAGTPRLADCLACHEGGQAGTPEGRRQEAKLLAYARAKQEIPWVRIASLAPHTFFSHQRHVTLARIDCATCHGNIAETVALPAKPAVGFTMSWCMSCHEKRNADNDCLACHR